MTPVAIFVRVSKGSQDYTRQVADLTAFCDQQQYRIVDIIQEKISGARKNKDREGIQKLNNLAGSRKIRKVLVTEVSRLGRNTKEVLNVLEDLSDVGVSVYVQNFNLETLNEDGSRNPMAQLIFTILAEFARLERETLRERICSGLQEAKRKGIILGRRKGSTQSKEKLLEKYAPAVRQLRAGKSVRDVASICNIGVSTVQRIKKTLKADL